MTSPSDSNAWPPIESAGLDAGTSGRAIVGVMATVEDAAFAQGVLSAVEIASWCEVCDDEHSARRWSVSVKRCDAAQAQRRLSMVPDV